MTKSKTITLGILGLMLTAILALAGCYPAANTTSSGTTPASDNGMSNWYLIIFLVVIFGLMYLLMIRPQRNRQKQLQKLVEELKRGDEVITTAGIYGVIESIEETSFVLKLEDGAKMRVIKSSVAGKRPETR